MKVFTKKFSPSVLTRVQQGAMSMDRIKQRLTQQKALGLGGEGFATNCTFMDTTPAMGIRHTNAELARRVQLAKQQASAFAASGPSQHSKLLAGKVAAASAYLASSAKVASSTRPSGVMAALQSSVQFEALLVERWGPGGNALAQHLLNLPQDAQLPAEKTHQHRLRLSSALQTVCTSPQRAIEVLDALARGRPTASPEVQATAEALRRALAATPTGMAALIHLEGKQGWTEAQQIAYRDSLEITAWLSQQANGRPAQAARGTGPVSGSLADFQAHALQSLQTSGRQNAAIGTDQDTPLQLAHQALLYAQDKMAASLPTDAPHPGLGAYVAWRNGYTHSTPDSPFRSAALHGLGRRMRKYVRRATRHGERSAKNLIKDLVRALFKMLTGKQKDPLFLAAAMGHATAARQRNKEEVAKFQGHLGEAIDALKAPLAQDIAALRRKVRTVYETGQLQEKVALWALLDLWQSKGIKGFQAEVPEVLLRAKAAYGEVVVQPSVVKSLVHAAGTGKMRLKKLEAWALQIFRPPANLRHAQQAQMRERLEALDQRGDARSPEESREWRYLQTMLSVARARELANGEALAPQDARNLFQFRDIWRLMTGRPPRQGVDLAWLRKILNEDMQGDEMIQSASDGGSYGVNPDFLLNTTLKAGGIPLGVILRGAFGNEAVVMVGDGAHGSELSVTKLSRKQATMGARLGYALGVFKLLKGTAAASAAYRYEQTQNKDKDGGVIVLIPQDRNTDEATNKQLAEQFLDFVLNFSSATPPWTPAELWAAYVALAGDTNRFSLGLREQSSASHSVQTNAALRAGVTLNESGLNAGATLGHEWISGVDYRKDHTGQFRVQRTTQQQDSYLHGGVSLTASGVAYRKISGHPLNTGAFPLLGGTVKVPLKSVGSTIRLLREQGTVNPIESYRDAIFATADDLARHLQECHTDWSRRARYEANDGQIHEGAAAIAQFVAEAKALAPGRSNLFTTRLMLDPQVAEEITLLESEAADMERSPSHAAHRQAELARIREEVRMRIEDERSWIPKWLAVAETVGGSTTMAGGIGVITAKTTNAYSTKPKSLRLFYPMDVRRSLIEERRELRT